MPGMAREEDVAAMKVLAENVHRAGRAVDGEAAGPSRGQAFRAGLP